MMNPVLQLFKLAPHRMIISSPAIGMEVKILFFAAGKRRQKRLQRTARLFLFWKNPFSLQKAERV